MMSGVRMGIMSPATNKEDGISIISRAAASRLLGRLLFSDADRLIRQGYARRLEPGDLSAAREPTLDTSSLLAAWDGGAAAGVVAPSNGEGSMLPRLLPRQNVTALMVTACLHLVAQACSVVAPLFLRQIVAGLHCAGDDCRPKSQLY